jgi:hypothetical protein
MPTNFISEIHVPQKHHVHDLELLFDQGGNRRGLGGFDACHGMSVDGSREKESGIHFQRRWSEELRN